MKGEQYLVHNNELLKENPYFNVGNALSKITNWSTKNVNFNLPQTYSITVEDTNKLKNLIKCPVSDDLRQLAYDNFGKIKKLNEHQLDEIKTSGTFKVPSILYEGENYVWKVNAFLQLGNDNNKTIFYKNLAFGIEQFIINVPNLLKEDKINALNGIKNIYNSVLDVPKLIVGYKDKKRYDDITINKKIKKSQNEILFQQLFGINELNEKTNLLIIRPINKPVINLSLYSNDKKFILIDNYKKIWSEWHRNRASIIDNICKSNINEISKLNQNDSSKLIKEIEIKLFQEEIYKMVKKTLSSDEYIMFFNFMKSIEIYRAFNLEFQQNMLNEFNKDLNIIKLANPIKSLIPKWIQKQQNELDKKISKKYNQEDLQMEIVEELPCKQSKFIFEKNLQIMNSANFALIKKEIKEKEFPSGIYNWQIKKIKNNFEVNELPYYNIEVNTNNHFWRFKNWFWRICSVFIFCNFYLFMNMCFGTCSIRSLYGIDEYESLFYEQRNEKYIPWLGCINILWKNIAKSRTKFLQNADETFLGKRFSNIINLINNYLIKGVIFTFLLLIGYPICTLINIILISITIMTSIFWVPIYSSCCFLFHILIFDFNSPSNKIYKWFPLFSIIIGKFLIGGFGQFLISILEIMMYISYGSLIFLWTYARYFVRQLYDNLMFHCIIKPLARIPTKNHPIVKKIAGPNVLSKYFYKISPELVVILFNHYLHIKEIAAYKKFVEKEINLPLKNLEDFYNNFQQFGLKIDTNSKIYQEIYNTKQNLMKILNENIELYLKNINIFEKRYDIKLNRNDLNLAMEKCNLICEEYVKTNIFKFMNQKEIEEFWEENQLFINNWSKLTENYLGKAICDNILIPIESCHDQNCKIEIDNLTIKNVFEKLFRGQIIKSTDRIFIPYIGDNKDFHFDETKLISPNNMLINEFPGEEFIKINMKYLNKYLDKNKK